MRDIRLTKKSTLLVVISLSGFLTGFDYTALNVAIPELSQLFHSSYSITSWVLLAYALVFVSFSMPAGNLMTLFGVRALLYVGFAVYAIGSVLCGIAPNIYILIAARALQAIGGAILFVSGPALVRTQLPKQDRGHGYGVAALAPTIGVFAGPALGALVITELGWRWIFAINLPVCALGILLINGLESTSNRHAAEKQKLDVPGALLLFVALVCFVLAVNQGTELGWTNPIILAMCCLSAVCITGFIYWELNSEDASMDIRLLLERPFLIGSLAVFLFLMLYGGLNFSMPIFLNQIKGLATGSVGLVMAIQPMVVLIMTLFAGWLAKAIAVDARAKMGFALLLIALLLALEDHLTTGILLIACVLFLFGLGQSLFLASTIEMTLEQIDEGRAARANGLLSTLRTLGQLIGVVMFETLLSESVGANNIQVTPTQGDHYDFRSIFWFALSVSVMAGFAAIYLARLVSHAAEGEAP
ncbi:MAG: MFS transporter [Pseudomonadota bacterium]